MKKFASPGTPMPRKDRPNVLPLEGEIDLHVSPTVTASLNAMIEKKPKRLVVDLSHVTYIDGGKFALVGLQETVRSIFEISRLDQVFQIFPDVDTAMSG
jgi:anti-anti-sigma regulatory factor